VKLDKFSSNNFTSIRLSLSSDFRPNSFCFL